jgi:hypothetical protein
MKPDMDIALSMFENLKEVKKMLGNGSSDDLASSAGIVRTASAPTKRSKISKALNHLNQAAELYEAVGDTRRAYFVTKLMTRVASELDSLDFGDESELTPETIRFSDEPSEDGPEWAQFLRDEENKELDNSGGELGFGFSDSPDYLSPELLEAVRSLSPEQREMLLKLPDYTGDEVKVDIDPDQISSEEAHPWFGKDEEKDN